jgi:DNA-binding CsgD family transcriptional regulator
MSLTMAYRRIAIPTIVGLTVVANIVLGVTWQLALLAGVAVMLFAVLAPRLPGPRLERVQDSIPPPEPPPPPAHPLSRNELEVAILVGRGLTNKKIARIRFKAERTIDNQIQSCYNKLNMNSRVELALWVRDHGFLPDQTELKDGRGADGRPTK